MVFILHVCGHALGMHHAFMNHVPFETAVDQNLVPLVNIKIGGKFMF